MMLAKRLILALAVLPTLSAQAIWKPKPETSWQWQLTTPVDLSVAAEVYDVDLFANAASVVSSLHAGGRKAICYLSVGTFEPFRPDAASFPESVKGKKLKDFPDEKWLDIRRWDILGPIIEARLDLCKTKGFDAAEPDNVDGYSNDSGFPLTAADQITFNRRVADAAHARGLSVGLKNDLDQAKDLQPFFDWALNEQCFQYKECGNLTWFTAAGKAVFQVEYELAPNAFCPTANSLNFNSLRKNYDLDAYRVPCRVTAASTIKVTSVLNAASYAAGVSAGMIAAIFGTDLGPAAALGPRLTTPGLIDSTLADTRILIDGVPAPLLYLGPTQAIAVIPYGAAGKGTVLVRVARGSEVSETFPVAVQASLPGIFTSNGAGSGQAAALNETGSLNTVSSPAARGSIVTFFVTGEGLVTPLPRDGQLASMPYPAPVMEVSVRIGGQPASVLYAGAAPQQVSGLLQVNARIASSAAGGEAVPITVTIGAQSSQAGVTIAVAP